MINRAAVDQIGRHVLITVAALSAVACAGGGGGGSSPSTNISSPPSPPSPPAPPPPPPGPSASSAEFKKNYALGAIHADAAYAVYATGAGVTIALVDTGVDPNTPDLSGVVSSLSTDVLPGRNQPVGTDSHANFIAGVIASNFNGAGTVGVAYGSTILSIRADQSTGCTGSTNCFDDNVLATGIQYAIAHGAKIINLSVGGPGQDNNAFQAALLQAVNAGLIVTVSAGNDSAANPDYPGMYAVDPRFQGSVVAVGSTNSSGALSSFSNKAGTAATGYLAAPGENLVTNCSATSCIQGSGTSFSAPVVAGALALLLQTFPNLTGRQALNILFTTATDAGATGVDSVYGEGVLNLSQAFAPIGTLSVPSSVGAPVGVNNTPGVYVTSAFGDAIASSRSLKSVGLDAYHRLFAINVGSLYRAGGFSVVGVASSAMPERTDVEIPSFASGRLQLTASLPDESAPDPSTRFRWMKPPTGGGDVTLTYRNGPVTLMTWRGAGVANPFSSPSVDPFTALAQPDHAFRADFTQGVLTVSTEAGAGQRLSPDRTRVWTGSSYLRATGQLKMGPGVGALTIGELVEPLGPLGSYLPAQSGLALPSKTAFLTLSQSWPLGGGYSVNGNVSLGRTQIAGQLLSLPSAAWSSSWRMALDSECRGFTVICSDVELSLSQPLRMEGGSFQAILPDVPDVYETSGFTYSARQVSVAPSGRQVDLRLATDKDLGDAGSLRFEGAVIRQPGNQARAPVAMGVDASWRVRF
ncbi:MAG TPA: S8 family peptidase [Caulobacteraceae bacterium]|nr:S8 family peptidase [Caulobacteraceae bacterium]